MGAQGAQGEIGATGAQGSIGAQGSTTTYLARLEFDATSTLVGGYFTDPSGAGVFSTTGASVGTPSGTTVSFTFTNQSLPPVGVLVYAADTRTGANAKYVITHLNAGGDNLNYHVRGISSWSSYSSPLSVANQVDANLFGGFGSLNIQLDLAKTNFDWERNSLSPIQNTHVYILFRF